MKQVTVLTVLLLVSASLFAGSFWDGSAVMSAYGEFPVTGYYAGCNSFPRNTLIEVKNLENGKTVQVIVTQSVESPGIFITLSPEAATLIGIVPGQMFRIRVTIPQNAQDPVSSIETNFNSSDPDLNPAILAQNQLAKTRNAEVALAAQKPDTRVEPVTEVTPPVIEVKPPVTEVTPPVTEVTPVELPPKTTIPERPEAFVVVQPPKRNTGSTQLLKSPDYSRMEETADPSLTRTSPSTPPIAQVMPLVSPEVQETVSVAKAENEKSDGPNPDPILDFTMYASGQKPKLETLDDVPDAQTKPRIAGKTRRISGLALAEPEVLDPSTYDIAVLEEKADAVDYSKATQKLSSFDVSLSEPALKPDELPLETITLTLKSPESPVIPPLADCEIELDEAKPEGLALKTAPDSSYHGVLAEPSISENLASADPSAERLTGIRTAFDSVLAPPELEPMDLAEASGERLAIGESAIDAELLMPQVSTAADIAQASNSGIPAPTEPEKKAQPEFPVGENNVLSLEQTGVKPPPAKIDEKKLVDAQEAIKLPVEQPQPAKIPEKPKTALTTKAEIMKVDSFEKGKSYIQLGAFSTVESLNRAANLAQAGSTLMYESVVVGGKTVFRLFVGPLKRDESGVFLLKLKSLGFRDAFIKKEG